MLINKTVGSLDFCHPRGISSAYAPGGLTVRIVSSTLRRENRGLPTQPLDEGFREEKFADRSRGSNALHSCAIENVFSKAMTIKISVDEKI